LLIPDCRLGQISNWQSQQVQRNISDEADFGLSNQINQHQQLNIGYTGHTQTQLEVMSDQT